MRPLSLVPCLAAALGVAACASADGEWPSLARRPGEAGGGCCGDAVSQPPAPSPAKLAPAPTAAVIIDLAALGERLQRARAAWDAQHQRAVAAVDVATGPKPGETGAATAELEVSRLEENGSEFRDIADEAGVVTSPEQSPQAAALAKQAQTAYDAHIAAFDALRRRLAAAAR